MKYGKIRQRYFLLALCIICLLGPVLTDCFLEKTGKRRLAVPVVSAEKIQKIPEEGYTEYTVKPALYFDGHAPAYDSAEEVYYITQNMDGDFFSGALSSSEGKLYWQRDVYFSDFADALSEGHLFSLYCVNDKTKKWCRYNVVFSGMPIMVIETKSKKAIDDDLVEATMQLFNLKFPGQEYTAGSCQARLRGGSSRQFDKKSYKLVLDEKQSLLGMRTDDDWILASLYDDAGLIHNKFSYDVWRDIASDNAVRKDGGTTMEYIELFCNNTYLGVYGLIERIDAKELSLDKAKDILYKCEGYELPRKPQEWSDILEEDYSIEFPKEYDSAKWAPLQAYLEVFTAAEGIADYEQALSMLNMENAIDHNLFVIFAYGCDNYKRKNTFFVAEWGGNADPGYTIIKVPWDCNATWGNFWRANQKTNNTIYEPERIMDPNLWSEDIKALFLCRPDEIGKMLRERWFALRKDVLSRERLIGMLDEDYSYLYGSGAYDRNYRLWPNGTSYWEDAYIYEYVEGRLEFLDGYFEDVYLDEVLTLDY